MSVCMFLRLVRRVGALQLLFHELPNPSPAIVMIFGFQIIQDLLI